MSRDDAVKDEKPLPLWSLSDRADPPARDIADRHYNRQKPGTPQFVPPGRCIVLLADESVWVTSWPFPQYVKHAWPGAWVNSAFRKEGGDDHASEYIRQAVAATRAIAEIDTAWERGVIPALGMVTFIDPVKVKPRMVRGRPTWGHSYMEAGFKHVGYTKGGLWAMQLLGAEMPPAQLPRGVTQRLEMIA